MNTEKFQPPAGSMLAKLIEDKSLIGDKGGETPEGGVSYDTASAGWAVFCSLGADDHPLASYLAVAKRSHKIGLHPVKDVGLDASALCLPESDYHELMSFIQKLGKVKKRRR